MGLLANLPIALAPGEFILVHSSHTHVDDRIKTIQLELLKQEWA
jgi:hypothetical protein